jgi:hypothetical protein
MNVIDSKTPQQLLQSLVAEVAKAQNELRCAQGDITKATTRQQFLLAVLNDLLQRSKDHQDEIDPTSP